MDEKTSVDFPVLSLPWPHFYSQNRSYIPCLDGHVTHDFLYCDEKSACMHENNVKNCRLYNARGTRQQPGDSGSTVAMFPCTDGSTLPYTLVCDFKDDCWDASDESFCIHSHVCPGFTCNNGQCVPKEKRCDDYKDCWDESDEICNSRNIFYFQPPVWYPPPVVINFTSSGHVLQQPMDVSGSVCPQTHFSCSGGYCFPVYVFCNGVVECPFGEDETGCWDHQCLGFYRCRSSRVCLHPEQLCDGWPQCPQRDDEWLCEATCPPGCRCQGWAFVCSTPFSVHSFPHLRYLDGSHSGMKPHNILNTYLIWLRLSSCGLTQVKGMNLPNLKVLDLSHNLLTSLIFDVFVLWFVTMIILTGNGVFVFARLFIRKTALLNGFNILLTNINVADLLMGVSFLSIVTADLAYRGNYNSAEAVWRSSPVCLAAGFLSLLSSQCSLFLTCLFLLERHIALRTVRVKLQFTPRSTAVLSGVVWCLAIFVSAAFLPMTSRRTLHSHNGICVSMPVLKQSLFRTEYPFKVRTVFNCILCSFVGVGLSYTLWLLRPGSEVVGSGSQRSDSVCHEDTIIKEQRLQSQSLKCHE
ncbi:uncharacterized protein LOC143296263 [Babylonia areolata]|uniref:uncharacterized protein LOC143296263 n=1 Tax=Babylonia areolata TaxID=304850 RepID=UPI003FCFEECB